MLKYLHNKKGAKNIGPFWSLYKFMKIVNKNVLYFMTVVNAHNAVLK